jgi:hypothetical protein
MANQDETKTINVKGVSAAAWDRARQCADKTDESLGVWLSRAIETQANLEAGPREWPPVKPEPDVVKLAAPLTPDEYKVLCEGMEIARRVSGQPVPPNLSKQLDLLSLDILRAARGLTGRSSLGRRQHDEPVPELRLIG